MRFSISAKMALVALVLILLMAGITGFLTLRAPAEETQAEATPLPASMEVATP